MSWFSDLYQKRLAWHEANVLNGFEDGMRRLMVDKYADPSHFVYELLQNAEDQGATEAKFELGSAGLKFTHNGSPFTPEDVESITGVCISGKPDQPNKIGRFGIGFKSVFAVTQRPEVFTTLDGESFAFAIEHLVVPVETPHRDDCRAEGQTTFLLPFPNECKDSLGDIISDRLQTLGADTMLFLQHLGWIEWTTPSATGTYLCSRSDANCLSLHAQIQLAGKAEEITTAEYALFSKSVHLDGADRDLQVKIAFKLDRGRIVPEGNHSTLNVFFPTREQTRLHFRVHGPFLLNDGRANLRDGAEENVRLMSACGELLGETLPQLRDRGYLSPESLATLPIRPGDFLGSPFQPLFDATLKALTSERLIPTDEAELGYVRAGEARITDSQPLRNLLTSQQITSLFSTDRTGSRLAWVSSKIQSKAGATKELYDYLKGPLDVDELDADRVATRINLQFLEDQTDEWMCELYKFLENQSSLWRPRSGSQPQGTLRAKPIIRTESNDHVAPFNDDGSPRVFLPSGVGSAERTVKECIAAHEGAMGFFTKLEIPRRSSIDEVLEVILPRIRAYRPDDCLASYTTFLPAYLAEIRTIRSAIDETTPNRQLQLWSGLVESPFVLAFNADDDSVLSMKKPGEVCQQTEELSYWFAGDPHRWFVSSDLAEEQDWGTILSFLNAHQQVVLEELCVDFRKSSGTGHVTLLSNWGEHERGLDRFDPEATLKGLEFALRNINAPRAAILWRLLLEQPYLIRGKKETSTYKDFRNSTQVELKSPLGRSCSTHAWLPDREGNWHIPQEISLSELDEGLETASTSAEILAGQLQMKGLKEREAFRNLGVGEDDLWVFTELVRNPRLLDKLKTELVQERTRAPFPDAPIPLAPGFATAVSHEAQQATAITYEDRVRSVRSSYGSPRQDDRTYLISRYTDADGLLRCQICENPMPFDLEDGRPYFEAVECLRLVRKELPQNHLALCPICAAKFRHARATSDAEFYRDFMNEVQAAASVPVTLARQACRVRFNTKHAEELRLAVMSILKDS